VLARSAIIGVKFLLGSLELKLEDLLLLDGLEKHLVTFLGGAIVRKYVIKVDNET
jgi:hypothetical protein